MHSVNSAEWVIVEAAARFLQMNGATGKVGGRRATKKPGVETCCLIQEVRLQNQ